MNNAPKITVGIVTRNRLEQLKKAIKSVHDQNYPNLEILVVDNASDDGTSQTLMREYPEVRLIRREENLGCPGGRNRLYPYARGEIIVNLDDDGWLGEGVLVRLVEIFAADPAIGVVAGQMLDEAVTPQEAPSGRWWETGVFWGGVSAFRARMLEETGFFPADFFFFKEEEYLSLKVLNAGWRIVYHPGFIVLHPPLQHRSGRDISRDYYLFRNPLFVVIELFPGIYLWKYLLLRMTSYALASLRRGSFPAYCRAVATLPKKLARTLGRRRPVRASTLRRYLVLRGNLPMPEDPLAGD